MSAIIYLFEEQEGPMTKSSSTTETTATTSATASATTTTVQPTTMTVIVTASNESKSVTEEDAPAVLSGEFHLCYGYNSTAFRA